MMMPSTRSHSSIVFLALVVSALSASGFVPLHVHPHSRYGSQLTVSELAAKKNKKKASSGKGFGQAKEEEPATTTSVTNTVSEPPASASVSDQASSAFLQSVEGGSTDKPELAPEDRAKQLLREKYGMKTLEEERLEEKQREQLIAQRKKLAELKAKADAGEDIDLIALIPGNVLQGIYFVLKLGIGITGTAFLLSGVGITIEAWSKASQSPLPENVDSFIVNVIEPYFTAELLVLLGFSISLGVLAALQLGSKSAVYREE